MLRKLSLASVWILGFALPETLLAISGNSCSVTVNGTVNNSVLAFTSCSTISVFTTPNINFISGTPMPAGMLITKSSSSGGNATWQISGLPTEAGTGTGVYTFTDSNPGAVTITINYNIAAPVSVSGTLPPGTAGFAYPATPLTAAGGTGTGFTFVVASGNLPTGLSLSSAGLITGSTTAAGTFNFTVQATDSGSSTGNSSFTILVNPALSMPPSAMLARTSGQTYSSTYSASGGTPPLTYSVSAGTLAPGALFNAATGAITGTAGTSTSSSFTVTATDARGASASTVVSYAIAPVPAIQMTTPIATLGALYSQSVVFVGAITSTSLASGTLPPGLAFNPAGTLLSGTPTTAGTYNFTLSGTDSNGVSASTSFTITATAALTISTTSLPAGTYLSTYNATIVAGGGSPPLTYTLTAGSLPPGLSLAATGAISGSASAPGTSSFTVTVTDTLSATTSRALSITIDAPPIVFTTSSLPAAQQGSSYSSTVAATGGAGTLSYAVTVGALPLGLSMSSSGAIGGSPTSIGTSSFTVTATDLFGGTATIALTIQVASPPIVFPSGSLPVANIGSSYGASIGASGGSGPLTYAVTLGSLPLGLSLSNSGLVSGTPTAVGSSSFTISASDSFGNTALKSFVLPVISPLSILTGPLLNPSTVGATVAIPIATTGGTAPLTWSVVGSLPPGLALSNGSITGTPTVAGQFTFSLSASDTNGAAASAQFSIRINSGLAFLSQTLGGPYSSEGRMNLFLLASGGTAPLTWSVSSGLLPPGIVLNPTTGLMFGAFFAIGTYPMRIRVMDAAGASIEKTYTIVVHKGPQFASGIIHPATVNWPYRAEIEVYAALPITEWRIATPLTFPPGIRLVEPQLEGIPTKPGIYEFELNVKDESGAWATQAFKLVVNPTLELLDANGIVEVPRGRSWSWTIPRAGGSPPFRYQLLNGALPVGFSLNPQTGEISGSATDIGDSPFTVGVTDANNATTHRLYTLRTASGLDFRIDLLPRIFQLGRELKVALKVEGGVEPYAFGITQGSLPAGLVLEGSTIGGIPAQVGPSEVSINVTDAAGATVTKTIGFQILDGIEVQPRRLDFTVLSGSWFSTPHTLKWLSAPCDIPLKIVARSLWVRFAAGPHAVPGFSEVSIEPMGLPPGFSDTELILQCGQTSTVVPIRVEKLQANSTAWSMDSVPAHSGGHATLLQATDLNVPFLATLDAAASNRFELSESRGEIEGPDSFLLSLERKQGAGEARGPMNLEVRNLKTGERQSLPIPESIPAEVEASASQLRIFADLNSTSSSTRPLLLRSIHGRPMRIAALADQPWVHVEMVSGSGTASVLSRIGAKPLDLPKGEHRSSIRFFNEAGEHIHTLDLTLEVGARLPEVELSAHSLWLGRNKSSFLLRLFNPSKQAASFEARSRNAAVKIENATGTIPAGGEVAMRITADASALNSWSRQYLTVAVDSKKLEIVEVDLGTSPAPNGCPSISPVISFLNPGSGFIARIDEALDFRLAVRNGCGEAIPGMVLALRIPGQPPIALQPDSEGIWHGAWIPKAAMENIQIEAIWLNGKNQKGLSRYLSGSVQR